MEFRIEDRRGPEEWKKEYEENRDRLKKLINDFLEDRPDGAWKQDALNDLKLIEEVDGVLKDREEAVSKMNLSSSDKETFNSLYIATLRMYVSQYEIMIEYYDNLPFDLYENKKHMKEIEKLNNLIKKVLKEELGEAGDKMIVSDKDPKKMEKLKAAKAAGVTAVVDDPTDPASDKLKETEVDVNETPATHDLAGKIAEVIDSLKAITEAPKDAKHAKYAEKVMKHMEAAKTALDGLTSHEGLLEEKDAAEQEKDAGKHLMGIRKHMSKVIKDKETLDRIMNKMPVGKAMELKKAAGGELDEEKVAKAMLKYVIKEGLIK